MWSFRVAALVGRSNIGPILQGDGACRRNCYRLLLQCLVKNRHHKRLDRTIDLVIGWTACRVRNADLKWDHSNDIVYLQMT